MGVTTGIVLKLVSGLENKGHHLYCDNYYSSPELFLRLKALGFGACGTARTNRRGIPASLKSTASMGRGQVKSTSSDGLLALQWQDKRKVTMISTIHYDSMVSKRRRTRLAEGEIEEIMKPEVIYEYNTYMGGVDKSDQLLSYYPFTHRTLKWWKRAFFHLLELAMVNAYIMYTLSIQRGKRLNHQQFRQELVTNKGGKKQNIWITP